MKEICFFNHYHNGDLFHSKPFIKQIVETIDTKMYYAHSNNPIAIMDLDVEHITIPTINNYQKFFDSEYVFYVNTWIGSYFGNGVEYSGECTLRFSYNMFRDIYDKLNEEFGCDLQLKPIEEYFPYVDYSKFDCSKIDQFISTDDSKKALFSNGPCLSGQCHYSGDMAEIIETLATANPEITFIATHKFNTSAVNIKFTNDILNLNKCDLNEISYLSTFCDIIVGRNSGPFCYSTTKENLNNPNKIFYAFGERETDCFIYGLDVECTFVFEYFSSIKTTIESISNLITQL
jgi:hypothetical protein